MKHLSPTELPSLGFDLKKGETTKSFRVPAANIGWLHSQSNQPGAKFDVTIKDIFGNVKLFKKNCGNETTRFGEMINLPTMIGENLEVVLSNVRGAERIDLFLN